MLKMNFKLKTATNIINQKQHNFIKLPQKLKNHCKRNNLKRNKVQHKISSDTTIEKFHKLYEIKT
ncbi:hypothetical protein DOY81_003059 [Sarcophaga bullata]|nr:hypothetical protein DOY81_003059 [Sarcophaga bullata]